MTTTFCKQCSDIRLRLRLLLRLRQRLLLRLGLRQLLRQLVLLHLVLRLLLLMHLRLLLLLGLRQRLRLLLLLLLRLRLDLRLLVGAIIGIISVRWLDEEKGLSPRKLETTRRGSFPKAPAQPCQKRKASLAARAPLPPTRFRKH